MFHAFLFGAIKFLLQIILEPDVETMTVLIGIYQSNDMASPVAGSQNVELGQLVSAGPFATRNQALAWLNYMQKRCGCGLLPGKDSLETKPLPWFGYTIHR